MPTLNTMEDFQRDLSYRVRRSDDGIVLTASLKDKYHDIFMELVADESTLVLKSASVDFRRAPTKGCVNVAERFASLAGMTIGKGMTRRIMETLGGGEGCGNLRTILLALLPLAMNVQAAAGITDEQEMLDTIHNRLVGTCAGYTEPVSR